jgi:hypothetical protein
MMAPNSILAPNCITTFIALNSYRQPCTELIRTQNTDYFAQNSKRLVEGTELGRLAPNKIGISRDLLTLRPILNHKSSTG